MTVGRKTTPAPISKELAINESAVRADFAAVAALGAQEQERATALAEQIGYEGSLTVGALEDEIRFYQRRTVETILETGKRLLLLREMTPHGDFMKRAELLGFSDRTANRFMQAASKTVKSAKLANLSTQVKNGSAFLELVTHDDDELKALDGMDDIDRMSASQLRAALREAKAENTASEELLGKRDNSIKRLEIEVKRFEKLPADEKIKQLQDDAVKTMNEAAGCIEGLMHKAFLAVVNSSDDRHQHDVFLSGLVGQVQVALNGLRAEFSLPDVSEASSRVDDQAWAAVREGMAASRAGKGEV